MINRHATPEAKITLYRSLFRGREDVYPRRFESRRTGKAGYVPACANEWIRGVCDKRATPCTKCPNRRFLPVTDDVIRQHLLGQDSGGREFVVGLYPMLLDETCFVLAADFDEANWMEDAAAVQETCRQSGIPSALERSRSGNGAHLWLFFEEALPAVLARKVGAHLLTETMERRPEIGLRSYDRFFPNQDTLPKGQLGNLIALPLQKVPRDHGNSLFLDDAMVPYADQWAFLAAVRKISRSEVERIVRSAESARGNVVGVRLVPWDETADAPWTAPPSRRPASAPIAGQMPQSMEIVIGNEIYVAKEGLPPALRNRLIRLAAFQNPEFYRAQAMRLPTFDKPRVIACAEDHPQHIALPRGCLEDLLNMLAGLQIKVTLRDERHSGVPFAVTFQGELRPVRIPERVGHRFRDVIGHLFRNLPDTDSGMMPDSFCSVRNECPRGSGMA